MFHKKCSRCDKPRLPKQRLCRIHKNEYLRIRRQTDPQQQAADRAHQIAAYWRDTGKLPREPCKICGYPEAQMHHPDYRKPHDIIWLCESCHRQFHKVTRFTDKLMRRLSAEREFSEHCAKLAAEINGL